LGVVGSNGFLNIKGNGMLYKYSNTRLIDCTEGASQTLIVGERGLLNDPSPFGYWCCTVNQASWWTTPYQGDALLPTTRGFKPASPEFDWETANATDFDAVMRFWSFHPSGANFAYVDGSLHFLDYEIDPETYWALSTRAGGEVVQNP